MRVVRCLFAAGIGSKLKDIVNIPAKAAELPPRVLRRDTLIFASDSILTGGSMNYVAATYFIYLKRNLMPNNHQSHAQQ